MAPTLHPQHRRSSSPPIVLTSNDGVLPLDLTHDIMLRLPTEAICRFRTVCRSWRSMLCHPDFIAVARNPGPLLAAAVCEQFPFYTVTILDTESGDELTQANVYAAERRSCSVDYMINERVVCVIGKNKRISLLDPATSAISVLPDHAPPQGASTWSTIGRAASSIGEYKVLAVSVAPTMSSQVCTILTLGDPGWRDTGSPPLKVVTLHSAVAVVNGVVYMLGCVQSARSTQQMIMEFDLECESWRPAALRGPLKHFGLSLAELQGHLVAGYDDRRTAIELWFLVDSDQSIWSKRYTITMPHDQYYCNEYFQKPLALLSDGRIVIWMRVHQPRYSNNAFEMFLRIYDPSTKTFSDGKRVPNGDRVTAFTWSVLHTGQSGALDMVARQAVISRRHH